MWISVGVDRFQKSSLFRVSGKGGANNGVVVHSHIFYEWIFISYPEVSVCFTAHGKKMGTQ